MRAGLLSLALNAGFSSARSPTLTPTTITPPLPPPPSTSTSTASSTESFEDTPTVTLPSLSPTVSGIVTPSSTATSDLTPTRTRPPTPTPTQTDTPIYYTQSCAEFDCGPRLTSIYWNWIGPQASCDGNCSFADCCTHGEGAPYAPRWAGFASCNTLGAVEVSTNVPDTNMCRAKCEADQMCYGYFWDNLASKCSVFMQPLEACSTARMNCTNCNFFTKTVVPWFSMQSNVRGCKGVYMQGERPRKDFFPPNALVNVSSTDCQRICENNRSCAATEWRFMDTPDMEEDYITGVVRLAVSFCILWEKVENCSISDEMVCPSNGPCWFVKEGMVKDCSVDMMDYLLHYGPVLLMGFLGLMGLSSAVLKCAACRQGGRDLEEPAQSCVKLFLIALGPLLAVTIAAALIGPLREILLGSCRALGEPPWGVNARLPVIGEPPSSSNISNITRSNATTGYNKDQLSADDDGTVSVHMFVGNRSGCPTDEEDPYDQFWEFGGSCWAPSDWGTQYAHLPDKGSLMWNLSFAEGMPSMGEYDFKLRCGSAKGLKAHPQVILEGNVGNDSMTESQRVIIFEQFKTKDATCKGAVWQVIFPEDECVNAFHDQAFKGGMAPIWLDVDCSPCRWLRWEGVKNAPYEMMIINSLFSLVVAGFMSLVVDNVIPILGDIIAKIPGVGEVYKRYCCDCCFSDEDEDGKGLKFVPCAPNDKRKRKLERGKRKKFREILNRGPKTEEEEEMVQLTCQPVGCPGFCDLMTDWPEVPSEEEDKEEEDESSSEIPQAASCAAPEDARTDTEMHETYATTELATTTVPTIPTRRHSHRQREPFCESHTDAETIAHSMRTHEVGAMEEATSTGWLSSRASSASPSPRNRPGATAPPPVNTYAPALDPDVLILRPNPLRSPEQNAMDAPCEVSPRSGGRHLGPPTVTMASSRNGDADERSKLKQELRPDNRGCFYCFDFVPYWAENTGMFLKDNWDELSDGLAESLGSFDSARQFAASRSAPSFSFVFVKSVFLWVMYAVTCREIVSQDYLGTFGQYQILYVRIVNSGVPLLLLESMRGVLAAWTVLNKQGGASPSEKANAIRSVLLCALTVILFVPPIISHILPMIVVFFWVPLLFYIIGWQFLMEAPTYLLNDVIARDWKGIVESSPWGAFILAEILGMWLKMASSFFVILPMQMLFNFGVLFYTLTPYWDIPMREIQSRSWDCHVHDDGEASLAAQLQTISFYF
eukprot:Hpha_TRINITY_DN16992_c0_g4::TRINITY_DN16992_c0_g4_i1::g.54113::m.54113